MIKPLSEQTSESLCAQQVITSLPDCIKELIDNSIDAKATYLRIVLHGYGIQQIQVLDNGMGIDNFDFLGRKGSTSKNKNNQNYDYLGFRGEAIHSIARVSGSMTIESKSAKDGHRRQFNVTSAQLQQFKEERICHGEFNFKLPNREGSSNTGTRVIITDVFSNLPVRRIQLSQKYTHFLIRISELIKQFCLIYPECQFILINVRKGKEQVLIQTISHKIFNKMAWLQRIKELDQKIGSSLIYLSSQYFQGFVLNKIQSGSSKENLFIKKNFHYMFVNRRPVDPIAFILSALNQIYKKYNNSTKYAFVLNLKLGHEHIDINLTPNKREIFVRKQMLEKIVEQLKKQIMEHVIQDIPTLSNYQDKKKPQHFDTNKSISMGDKLGKKDDVITRKTVSFAVIQNDLTERESYNAFDKSSLFRASMDGARSSMKGEQKKQQIGNKSKSMSDLPELPKISIDMVKLKERLNSKISVDISSIKRMSSGDIAFPVKNNSGQVKPSNFQNELQSIRKQNQQKKLREEYDDAKKRAEFLKEVKLEQIQEEVRKLKANSQKSHVNAQPLKNLNYTVSQTSSRTNKNRQNLMQQQIMKQKERAYENDQPIIKPLREDNEMDIEENGDKNEQQIISGYVAKHDKQLQARIKSKLNIDMSQIFTKFNQKKQNKDIKMEVQQPKNSSVFQNKIQERHIDDCCSGKIQKIPLSNYKQNLEQNLKQDQQQMTYISDLPEKFVAKSLKKANFLQFEILGQFNLGFIVCQYNSKIFLIDQHAASQKYHYQKFLNYSKSLQMINCFEEKQITSIEADQIQDCKHLLAQAHFFYEIIDRKQLMLQRCPSFMDQKLGMNYFMEIVEQKKQLYRLKSFTQMCAKKACRTAVMVGTSLKKAQMIPIVKKLADLQSPWNCPHGRPTLIELGINSNLKKQVKRIKVYDF